MTIEISRNALAEYIARRLLSEIEEHGGIEEFCEKLTSYPEMCLEELAFSSVDCAGLCGCLHPRVQP